VAWRGERKIMANEKISKMKAKESENENEISIMA
jgi:hypothetical protein